MRCWVFFVLGMALLPTAWGVELPRVLALLPPKAMLSIDGQTRVLTEGEESPEGWRLLAVDPHWAQVEYDGVIWVLRTKTHYGKHIHLQGGAIRRVEVPLNAQGSYQVQGQINGRPTRMIVDTGASLVALSATQAQALGLNYEQGPRIQVQTASQMVWGWRVQLAHIDVQGVHLQDVDAVVLPGDYPRVVLLGMSFLRRIRVEQDGNSLILQQSH